ncbi:MAG: hypothetical protein R3Y60_03030 [bacterium]
MATKEKKEGIYSKAIKNRVIIMLVIIFIMLPILFSIGLFTSTYTSTKPNPFSEDIYTKTSIKYLNENKFEIDRYDLKTFKVEVDGEGMENGSVILNLALGAKIDTNITSSSITISSYVCYNWANVTSSNMSRSISYNSNTTVSGTIDTTFNQRPYLFVNIDLLNDARILTKFTWSETNSEGETISLNYVVESSFKDLYVSDSTLLT